MIIHPLEVIAEGDTIRLQSLVEHAGGAEPLWFSFDRRFEPYLTVEKLDGFLVGLILLAMQNREDITVRGAVSEKLYYNLTNYFMPIHRLLLPGSEPIRIHADTLDNGRSYRGGRAVLTGFSAGIDSFATVIDHSGDKVPEHYRVTHLVFNNVGSHGEYDPERAGSLFRSRYGLIEEYAEESGLDLIKVDSNLSEVVKQKFQLSHLSRNTSSILLLQRLAGVFYYASSFRYLDTYIGKVHTVALADPYTVHLLSTETLQCISSGGQFSRIDKTRQIVGVDSVRRRLNVCVSTRTEGKNCAICWKCMRTLLTLEVLGELSNFDRAFDLKRWTWVRKWYLIEKVFNSRTRDPLIDEIFAYADEIGYKFELRYRVLGRLVGLTPQPLYQAVKRLLRFLHQLIWVKS